MDPPKSGPLLTVLSFVIGLRSRCVPAVTRFHLSIATFRRPGQGSRLDAHCRKGRLLLDFRSESMQPLAKREPFFPQTIEPQMLRRQPRFAFAKSEIQQSDRRSNSPRSPKQSPAAELPPYLNPF